MSRPAVIVTGASKGVGLAVAQTLLETYGAKVVTISRTLSRDLEELKSKYGDSLQIVLGDVSAPQTSLDALALEPNPAALVLNAAIALYDRIASTTVSHWHRTFEVNVFALLTLLTPAVPALRTNKGRVVFVSSGAAEGKLAGLAAYNASKAAMNAICRTFANEEPEIAAFAVHPGLVDTEFLTEFLAQGENVMSASEYAFIQDLRASGKASKPSEPGYVIASLAVKGEKELSGKFFMWNSKEGEAYMRK